MRAVVCHTVVSSSADNTIRVCFRMHVAKTYRANFCFIHNFISSFYGRKNVALHDHSNCRDKQTDRHHARSIRATYYMHSSLKITTVTAPRIFAMPDNDCYFAPGRDAKYCDENVRLSVCPLAYLRNHTAELHTKFCIVF